MMATESDVNVNRSVSLEETENDSHGDASHKRHSKPPIPQKDDRLCGYLVKCSSRGLIKSTRRRWFVFSENACKLYYYKSPQESTHLGEIEISVATFYYEVENIERPGLFFISTPEKTFELEAPDRKTCLYWLKELQKKRHEFSKKKSTQLQKLPTTAISPSIGIPNSGLLRQKSEDDTDSNDRDPDAALFDLNLRNSVDTSDKIEILPDEASSLTNEVTLRSSSGQPWSLSNVRDQVRRSLSALRTSRNSESSDVNEHVSGSPSENANKLLAHSKDSNLKRSTSSNEHDEEEKGGKKIPLLRRLPSLRLRKDESRDSKSKSVTEDRCKKCEQANAALASLSFDKSTSEEEVVECRNIISHLQKELDIACKQKESIQKLIQDSTNSSEKVDVVCQKVIEMEELSEKFKKKEDECTHLQTELESVKNELKQLKDQLSLYRETSDVKDQMIMKLADQVTSPDAPHGSENGKRTPVTSVEPPSSIKTAQEFSKLQVCPGGAEDISKH